MKVSGCSLKANERNSGSRHFPFPERILSYKHSQSQLDSTVSTNVFYKNLSCVRRPKLHKSNLSEIFNIKVVSYKQNINSILIASNCWLNNSYKKWRPFFG